MTGPDPDLKKGSGGPMPDLTQRGIRLHEKNEKKKQLQPAKEDQERGSQFGMYTVTCIVFYRTDRTEAGTYIAHAGK